MVSFVAKGYQYVDDMKLYFSYLFALGEAVEMAA